MFWPGGNMMSFSRNVSFVSKGKFGLEKCYQQFTRGLIVCFEWQRGEILKIQVKPIKLNILVLVGRQNTL